MKKKYIVTFQNAYNYGAILQCFALQETIKSIGENAIVLNYDNRNISDCYKPFQLRFEGIKVFIKSLLSGVYFYKKIKKRNSNFEKMIRENILLTSKMSKEQILNYNFDSNDVFISGSDQVWNTDILNGFDDIYFLNFAKKSHKISYAASIGKNHINDKYLNEIKKSLNNLSYVSVREETAKNVLSKIYNGKIDVVLDPTLLLDKNEWNRYLDEKRIIDKRYIFVYMINNDVLQLAQKIAKEEDLLIINMDKKKRFGINEKNMFTSSPLDFVKLVRDAEYIVTSSFHGTAISIIYNKKFWVSPPNGLSSRIVDLLKILKLENRMFNGKSLNELDYNEKIDYEKVNKIVKTEKKKSLDNLQNNILGE